jgi:hypothetical protein
LLTLPEGERASIGGPVPASMTYQDWFGEQTKERQLEILGPELFGKHEQGKLAKELESSRAFTYLDPKDYATIVNMEKFERWAEKMKERYDALREKYKDDIMAIRKEMPKSSIVIHGLPPQAQEMLGTKTDSVFFSADGFAKQLSHHPELSIGEYRKVFEKLKDSNEFYPGEKLYVALVVKSGREYMAIIKTTENSKEAYLVSLYRTDNKQLERFRKAKKEKRLP